ncbi:MAG: multicopper oxidase family protein, partial [Rhodospirillales bacterium]
MNRDISIVADDWLLSEDLQIHENTLGNLHDWSHAGRLGNSLTINGRFLPKIKIPHRGPTRLRVINAPNAR